MIVIASPSFKKLLSATALVASLVPLGCDTEAKQKCGPAACSEGVGFTLDGSYEMGVKYDLVLTAPSAANTATPLAACSFTIGATFPRLECESAAAHREILLTVQFPGQHYDKLTAAFFAAGVKVGEQTFEPKVETKPALDPKCGTCTSADVTWNTDQVLYPPRGLDASVSDAR